MELDNKFKLFSPSSVAVKISLLLVLAIRLNTSLALEY